MSVENYCLDILIPSLNEAKNLERLQQSLQEQEGLSLRVILVDGGSTDLTQQLCEDYSWTFVSAPKGRAKQLNQGLPYIKSDYFLVLHADSILVHKKQLRDSLDLLKEKNKDKETSYVGHWGLIFDRSTEEYPWAFRYPEEKSCQNRRYVINGDQGMLFPKDFFEKELVCFNEELPFMEDQEIAERVYQKGSWQLLPHHIKTSARRFESEGFHQRYILMAMMMGLYWCDIHEFFQRAVGVYRSQNQTHKLQLWPFFKVIWKVMKEDYGFVGSIKGWYKIGTYVRKQSWQLFFFFDVALREELGEGRYPFLKFHDKVFHPLTNNFICNFINSLICFFYFMGLLGPYFYVLEKILKSQDRDYAVRS